MKLEHISTPAVVIDDRIARANIAEYQSYCNEHKIALRPHIKTHKLPLYAIAQLEAGAVGITCQKISEAEIMAKYDINDILITYNILGKSKLDRLIELVRKVDRVRVVADNAKVAAGLAEAFSAHSMELEVLVECDTGGSRCGVATPEEALKLATLINELDGLVFGGLMTYPAADGTGDVQAFMAQTKELLAGKGIVCPCVSSGGSPDMKQAHLAPVVTEYRIGTYIYNDRSLVERGVCGWDDCALSVYATVVSTPTSNRAVIDAGSKVLTSDLLGLDGHGYIVGHSELSISQLSEEHGIINAPQGQSTGLSVGQRVEIVPNHCCVVSNMVNMVYLKHGNEDVTELYVLARGCVI